MANQIVQLTDSNNNNIFPVAGSMAGGSVETGMLQDEAVTTAKIDDGAVTTAKFAPYAVNTATKTANNLTPSADTPSAWSTLLGGDGYFWTYYSSNCFANQLDQYGQLETLISGTQIYQRWHGHTTGPCAYRGGNGTGWNSSASASGAFRFIKDSKTAYVPTNAHNIAQNSDLNTIGFIQPGAYVCNYTATVQTLSNCPATTAFRMTVENLLDRATEISSDNTWKYFIRTIVDIEGRVWQQRVSSNGSNPVVWAYGSWHMLSAGDGEGPINIDSFLTIASGHIADEYYFYRQGKLLYLSMVLHKTSGNFSSGEVVATLKSSYYPAYATNYMCALAVGGMWTTNTAGYLYISSVNGQITVGDSSAGCNYAKINLVYPLKG